MRPAFARGHGSADGFYPPPDVCVRAGLEGRGEASHDIPRARPPGQPHRGHPLSDAAGQHGPRTQPAAAFLTVAGDAPPRPLLFPSDVPRSPQLPSENHP